MAKKTMKGYKSYTDFESDLEEITDLSRLEDGNKLTEVLYKISGLYINSDEGNYLTGEIYSKMLRKLKRHLLKTTNYDNICYLDGTYYNYINKIINGDFKINFRDYSYTYEIENNVGLKRTNIDQIISLRKSMKLTNNNIDNNDCNEDGYKNIDEILEELNLITDLNIESQRDLLKKVIYKIIRLYGYKLILSTDVFDSINEIIDQFKKNLKNADYYTINSTDLTYIEKIIKSLLENNYPLMISTTLTSYYNFGLKDIEDDINYKVKRLTFKELYQLNESGKSYKKIDTKERNKIYINK